MNGKEKCNMLKMMRAKIAEENGIKGFEYEKCPYDGPCTGTCPACDAETNALYEILKNQGKEVEANDVKELKLFFNDMLTMGILEPEWQGSFEQRERQLIGDESEEIRLMGELALDEYNYVQTPPEDILEGKIVRPRLVLGEIEKPEHEPVVPSEPKQKLRGKVVKKEPKDKDIIRDNQKRLPRGLLGRLKKKKDGDD